MFRGIPWFYKSFWLEQGRVAFLEIVGELDHEGAMAFNHHMRAEYLSASKAPVSCVIDTATLSGDSRIIDDFCQELEITFKHRNVGAVIFVGCNEPGVSAFANRMAQNAVVPVKVVDNMSEAHSALRQIVQPALAS